MLTIGRLLRENVAPATCRCVANSSTSVAKLAVSFSPSHRFSWMTCLGMRRGLVLLCLPGVEANSVI